MYGEYQLLEGAYATVLGIFEKQYSEGKPLTITSDGKQRRDFTHVHDIVDGLVKCGHGLLDGKISGEEFELGSGVNYSINEVADMFGTDYPREYISKRKGEYDKTLCTDTNAHELLGWEPNKNIGDYIKDFVNNQ